jgi:hypothetical protein
MPTIEVRSVEGAVKVGDRVVESGETVRFETGGGLTVDEARPEDRPTVEPSMDVFSPANRPNGNVTAAIAPKLPKSSGELVQVPIGDTGRVAERAAADLGVATQGGGPDSPDTLTTPGPQPAPLGGGAGVGLAVAVGPGSGPGDAPGGDRGASPANVADTAHTPSRRASTKTAGRTASRKGR